MKPPTKFELMRAGRERLAYMLPRAAVERTLLDELLDQAAVNAASGIVSGVRIDAGRSYSVKTFEAKDPPPVVPTMEIDGVKYRELGRDTCTGCACEYRKSYCSQFNAAAMEVFKGFCGERKVIYVRAEA